jgi:hypothetical protein
MHVVAQTISLVAGVLLATVSVTVNQRTFHLRPVCEKVRIW